MPHCVVPSWLGEHEADRLLSYAVAEQARFKPTKVLYDGENAGRVDESARRSTVLRDLGPFSSLLRDRALAMQFELEKAFGMAHLAAGETEIELVAHGDGGFYHAHKDTFTGEDGAGANRRISLVYYFHRRPRRFSGGRLCLLGLGRWQAIAVEPTYDSLLAFPSFLPHEVEPISCPNGGFTDGRFAVNIWLCG